MLVGWGLPAGLVLMSVAYAYEDYGGEYHCWLQVDSKLFFIQLVPLVIFAILIFTTSSKHLDWCVFIQN